MAGLAEAASLAASRSAAATASARVTRAFVQGAGEVKLDNGETWTARLSAGVTDAEASVGQSVSVIAVRGAAVEVAPEPRPSTERTVEHD